MTVWAPGSWQQPVWAYFALRSRRARALLLGSVALLAVSLFVWSVGLAKDTNSKALDSMRHAVMRPFGFSTHQPNDKLQPTAAPTSLPTSAVMDETQPSAAAASSDGGEPAESAAESAADPPPGITEDEVQRYVGAILDYHNTTLFNRLACPAVIPPRYQILLRDSTPKKTGGPRKGTAAATARVKYFFALDLHQALYILPRLLGSIVEAIRFLGPEHCVLSIVEGRSDDGTYEVLAALRAELAALHIRFYLDTNSIDPKAEGTNRIVALSELRNQALKPLTQTSAAADEPQYAEDTIILFVNDVALCAEDLLELLFQHVTQSAHMTCAFDWQWSGTCFYDSWVSRSMAGNLFFEIPQDAKWDYFQSMFFDDPLNKRRYDAFLPVQVYSCWGGMVTLDARPFVNRQLRFRASDAGECYMGEPTLLAKDMWRLGIGKIAAIPTVNVAYNDEEAKSTKKERGYVGDHVNLTLSEPTDDERIPWLSEPPGMVKCLPAFNEPSWVRPF